MQFFEATRSENAHICRELSAIHIKILLKTCRKRKEFYCHRIRSFSTAAAAALIFVVVRDGRRTPFRGYLPSAVIPPE